MQRANAFSPHSTVVTFVRAVLVAGAVHHVARPRFDVRYVRRLRSRLRSLVTFAWQVATA